MNQMAVNQERSLLKKYGIPVENIDYDYVNKCHDPKELKHIIKILESGEEGHYPKLLMATENRLRQIKPDASILNRKLCFAQKSSDLVENEDFDDVFSDIAKWIKKSNQQEKDTQSVKQNPAIYTNGHSEPPVRKSTELTTMFNGEKSKQESSMPKPPTVQPEPLPTPLRSKWDKYDADVELLKLDNKEKVEKLQTQRKRNMNSNNLSVGISDTPNFKDRVRTVKEYVDSMSKCGNFNPQYMAMREKELGNECFNSTDYEEAICHYNTSISIYPTPEARNNRAMSFIKLNKYKQALEDLREVIEKDPRNVKAHFRRGSCFQKISMYCLALKSFQTTLKYDCNNIKAINFVKELTNIISNIPRKNLIRVREISRHYDQSVWDIEDPFHVSYLELAELNNESVEYLYEADSLGCLTECVCNLCPWHEWQLRKKRWGRHKMLKTEGPRKRWQFLTSDIVPVLISKTQSSDDVQRPKRLNITDVDNSKINNKYIDSMCTNHYNGVNGTDKSPCDQCENDGLSIKPISSVQEFLLRWKTASQKNNYELYHKLLRSIKPKDLPKVISTNLDEEIMSKFLETLNQKFDPDSEIDLIVEYLTAMTKVNRFNLIVKMLDNKVKEGFQPLLERVHNHTKNKSLFALL